MENNQGPFGAQTEVQHFKFLNYYEIQWSSNLLEVGDTVEIRFKNKTEAYIDVSLPFYKLYNFTPVAHDVSGEQLEKVHTSVLADNKVRIYAQTKDPYTGIFTVSYSAKGVR